MILVFCYYRYSNVKTQTDSTINALDKYLKKYESNIRKAVLTDS